MRIINVFLIISLHYWYRKNTKFGTKSIDFFLLMYFYCHLVDSWCHRLNDKSVSHCRGLTKLQILLFFETLVTIAELNYNMAAVLRIVFNFFDGALPCLKGLIQYSTRGNKKHHQFKYKQNTAKVIKWCMVCYCSKHNCVSAILGLCA